MDQEHTTPSSHEEKRPPSYSCRHTWQPGYLRQAPKLALASFVGIILCCIASVCLVVVTNNRNATYSISWVLGFLGSTATFLMMVVLANGVTINWWLTALKGGPLRRLHYIWSYGGSSAAWLSWSHVNLVAVASILTAISGIAYAPLLQRSSHIENQQSLSNVTMFIDLLRQVPDGYGGTVSYGSDANITLDPTGFLSDVQLWYQNSDLSTLNLSGYACNGWCEASVPVAGLSWNCNSQQETLSLETASKTGQPIFDIDFSRYDDPFGVPTLELKVVYASAIDEYCNGVLNKFTCQLQAALVEYPIYIQNQTIYVQNQPGQDVSSWWGNWGSPYRSPGDMANAPEGTAAGPLASLGWLGFAYYKSNATVNYDAAANSFTITALGIPSYDYLDTNSSDYAPSRCGFQWTDPTADIISDFESVMFWNAYGPGTYPTIAFPASQWQPTLIYRSEYVFLAIATILIILSLFSVSTLLYGWWDLGRPVSLSPLETAKAFGAQIFEGAPDDEKGILRSVGDRKFKYGEVDDVVHGGTKLVFAAMGDGGEPRAPTTTEIVNHA